MKTLKIVIFLFLGWTIFSCNKSVTCEIATSEGTILVELYPNKAPITVANFLKYLEAGLYDNTTFFRVTTPNNEATRDIKIEVIQGGDIPDEKCFPPIVIETTDKTGLKHLDGTISMARSEPNSAQSSFFICINDQPELDFSGKRNPDGYGFAAFGKVVKGMEVVRKIQAMENKEQTLINPVQIITIKRVN